MIPLGMTGVYVERERANFSSMSGSSQTFSFGSLIQPKSNFTVESVYSQASLFTTIKNSWTFLLIDIGFGWIQEIA